MSVTRQVRQKQILSGPGEQRSQHCNRDAKPWDRAAGLSLFDPAHDRWPGHYYQVTLLLGDFVLLLTGGLLLVTFHSLVEGIKAEEENKEFI
jgi:hypothetical protein